MLPQNPLPVTNYIEEFFPETKEKLQQYVTNFDKLWEYLSEWKIQTNNKVYRRLGACKYNHKIIELSGVLKACPKGAENTFKHELAHILAGSKAKHGPEWKAYARFLGAKPKAVSIFEDFSEDLQKAIQENMEVKTEKRILHTYACANCGYETYAGRLWKKTKYHKRCMNSPSKGIMEKK